MMGDPEKHNMDSAIKHLMETKSNVPHPEGRVVGFYYDPSEWPFWMTPMAVLAEITRRMETK